MQSLLIVAVAALWLVAGAFPAATQAAGALPCGRVTAYAAPTASGAGSITLGTSRFELAPGSAPDREIAVGSDMCIEGPRSATGAYTRVTVTPMGTGVCGVVTAYSASSASTEGSVDLSSTGGTVTALVAAGTTFSPDQVTGGQCFGIRVNSQGNAEIFRYSGVWNLAPTASPTAGGLPSTTVATTDAPVAVDPVPQPSDPIAPSWSLPAAAALAAAILILAGVVVLRVARRS